ncbi:MAG TPA: carboxypeptidase M32 [Spirochaetota bacterium]|nr:carboxypeptidase M32 [Spirochaetota bacterium]
MSYKKIIEKYNEIKNIEYANAIADWDQSTNMPPKGVESRAEICGMLSQIAHNLVISDDLFKIVEDIINSKEYLNLSDLQKNEIRVFKTLIEKERKIPTSLEVELSKTTSKAMSVWEIAKENNDDKDFLPLLKKIYELKKEYAKCLGYEKNPYDALLDCYDKGLKYQFIKPLFNTLEKNLVKLIDKISHSTDNRNNRLLNQNFDEKKQWDFGLEIIKDIGIDMKAFRQDKSTHPFTTKLGHNDIRITTDIQSNNLLKGLYSTIHETGHALYEQSVSQHFNKIYENTFIESPCSSIESLSLHESQSRFYENIIGRSFKFWKNYFPKLQKLFPKNLSSISCDDFYKAVNMVETTPIRIESDEITYNLHIILRTEIENELINGNLNIEEVESFWNKKTKGLLGFTPQKKNQGYLQDIHWSCGLIGYFPTYTIGNMISAQFYNELKPTLDKYDIYDANTFSIIKKWFNENLYNKGNIYTSMESVKLITNKELESEFFINYLETKFKEIYGGI